MESLNLSSLLILDDLPRSKANRPEPSLEIPSTPPVKRGPPPFQANGAVSAIPVHLYSLISSLMTLKGQILQDLESGLSHLLSLNRSRREAIADHLDRLAGTAGTKNPGERLCRWIEGPLTASQKQALQIYFEEIALLSLGQILLLKSWNDRGTRVWSLHDLSDLNAALDKTLRAHLPYNREGWQITRQSIYSWTRLSGPIQRDAWVTLESWNLSQESAALLGAVFGSLRRSPSESAGELRGFDPRFFEALWKASRGLGFDPTQNKNPIHRKFCAFCPTLRDGIIARTSPYPLEWVGLEANAFQLMTAEMMQLWREPSAPPYWAIGTGLEVHSRDQLLLALGSPKPSLYSRIAEMEACEIAFVLEEKAQQPSRDQMESLPYFKNLKSQRTTLGDLQACVAMSKLRPGGLLWWMRETPLSPEDGVPVLSFLLERGKLISHWDFSSLEHTLPVALPLLPKNLYLFKRDLDLQSRSTHRPCLITLNGSIRSHIEVPVVFEDALQCVSSDTTASRGQWQIHRQLSPTSQQEWIERWPEPMSSTLIRSLELLKAQGRPLGSFALVRPSSPAHSEAKESLLVEKSTSGFWIRCQSGPEGRRLVATPFSNPKSHHGTGSGNGFLIVLNDASQIAPILHFLESTLVAAWLDHHAERRGDKWVLTDQVIKWIPIPKALLVVLGISQSPESSFASGPTQSFSSEILGRMSRFSDAARELSELQIENAPLSKVIGPSGRIYWKALLEILPRTERVPITLHPSVKITGTLPSHSPITRMDRPKGKGLEILLANEAGFLCRLSSDKLTLIDMIWEQLDGVVHPTWGELVSDLQVPKNLSSAESIASELLGRYGENEARLKNLRERLCVCLNLEHSSSKIIH